MAAEGMVAVGLDPGKVGVGTAGNLDVEGPLGRFSAEHLDLGRESAQPSAYRVRGQRRVLQ
jgi:hypothetical protein